MGAGILIFLVVNGQICLHMWEKPDTEVPVVIVLGAQVKGTRPSRALERRLKKAEAFLKEHPDTWRFFPEARRRGRHHGSPVHVRLADRARHCFQTIDFGRALYQHGGNLKFSAAFLDKNSACGDSYQIIFMYTGTAPGKKAGVCQAMRNTSKVGCQIPGALSGERVFCTCERKNQREYIKA